MKNSQTKNSNINFLRTVFVGQARGESIIEICDKLASKDKFKSLRLIAKFKTLLSTKKEDVIFVINSLKREGFVIENPYDVVKEVEDVNKQKLTNVITFKDEKNSISETELNSLFLGLCKLVKRMALEEVQTSFKQKQLENEQKLKRQIENLQMLNEGLAMENRRLMEKVGGSTLQK